MRFSIAVLAPVFALSLACSANAPSAPAPDAGVDGPPARSEACLAQDQSMQTAIDGARTSPVAALAVDSPACGRTVYVSGNRALGDAQSLWRIGSVTKTFVSAVVLDLVREGKIALGDPLAKWVPGVPATDGVTVRMLMNHTSGIFNYTEVAAFFADRKRVWKPQEIVELATKNPPYFAPGAGFHYSNTNYVLLGMIAEKAGGAKIGTLVRERAIAKAGLDGIFFDGEEPVVGTMTRGFASNGKTDVTFLDDPSGPWAAGAIVARPGDLAAWVRALYGSDAVLDAERRALLVEKPVASGQYGLGVMLLDESQTTGGGTGLGHGGDISGFHTLAFYFPEKQTAIAVIVDRDGSDPNDVLVAAAPKAFE